MKISSVKEVFWTFNHSYHQNICVS